MIFTLYDVSVSVCDLDAVTRQLITQLKPSSQVISVALGPLVCVDVYSSLSNQVIQQRRAHVKLMSVAGVGASK